MCTLSSGSHSRCECGGLESRMEKGSSTHSFNGLKFGKKIYFEGVGSGLQPKIGGEEEEEEEEDAAAPRPPPRSPAKKGRTGVGQGGQPPRCQVEGCEIDLSGAKAYYCRHKVCGVHSKSPMVIVAGLEQRFCQQCSRFHQLPEFDQGKRSCRRRLAGHNERRRKPPPGPLLSSRNATLSPSIFDNHFKTGGVVTTDFTSNCQLPWESSSQPPPLPNLLQPSTTRPCYTDEDCISGISDSTSSALSLLSNWGSRTQPLDLGVNTNFLATDVAQPSLDPAARYSWDFKGDHDHDHADDNSLHDMGLLPRMSHPTNTPYGRDLGLARPGDVRHHGIEQPRGFDSSLQHINWSL